jgi:hypothetical protein
MSDANGTSEVGITTPAGSLSFRGKRMAEVIAVACLCLLFVMAYVLWDHRTISDQNEHAFISAVKEMTAAQKEATTIQREWMCLSTLSAERREREFLSPNGICKQLAR